MLKMRTAVLAFLFGSLLTACLGTTGSDDLTTGGNPGDMADQESPRNEPSTMMEEPKSLVVYSGRSENLVGPIIQQFEVNTGTEVAVRWGGSSELAATLLEEGANSPADVFFAQEPGALGAVHSLLSPLPETVLLKVSPESRDPSGRWVGVSGRARVVVYNTDRLSTEDLPEDLWGFTDPIWKGRIGWAPTNASFQAMVTAMRYAWGEERTRDWLSAMLANEPKSYDKNTPIVAATAAGEVDIGFVNHYYLHRFLSEQGSDFGARNYHLSDGGPGSLLLVAGAGILGSSTSKDVAVEFLEFLLSVEAQSYFADEVFEYPLLEGISEPEGLPPLESLRIPEIDYRQLNDVEGTITLLREVGVLP